MSRIDFGAKPFMFPMPVLIIGTYDENGVKPITYDPCNNTYTGLGGVVGKAFGDGLKFK